MSKRHFHEDDEEPTPEELSIFEFMERAVDLALQSHGVWNLEISGTMAPIFRVAENLTKVDTKDFRNIIYDPKKLAAVDRETLCKAFAIFKLVAIERWGWTREQLQKKIEKYMDEFD